MKNKIYAIEMIGSDSPTYATTDDVAKLVTAMNKGARLVLIGGDFVSPSSVRRIRRAWDVDSSDLSVPDDELKGLLGIVEAKRLK